MKTKTVEAKLSWAPMGRMPGRATVLRALKDIGLYNYRVVNGPAKSANYSSNFWDNELKTFVFEIGEPLLGEHPLARGIQIGRLEKELCADNLTFTFGKTKGEYGIDTKVIVRLWWSDRV